MKTPFGRLWPVISVPAVVLLAVSSVFAQSKNRILQWAEIPINNRNTIGSGGTEVFAQIEALEIQDITVDGKSITIGKPFAADDDWLKNLTVRVKNISDQSFSSLQIDMFLPEIMPGGPLVSLCYGCGDVGRGQSTMPGEEVLMKIAFYRWVSGEINSKTSLSAITKAQIHAIVAIQPDGKKLLSGCVRTADQKNACPKISP